MTDTTSRPRPSFARTAFTGRAWAENVELTNGDGSEVGFAMPGLIDGQCRVWGELAYPLAGRPFDPIDRCRELMVDAGVVGYREVGNTLGSRSWFESVAPTVPTPRGAVSGPTIDCAPGLHAQTRIVATIDDVYREVDRLAGECVQVISTGSFLSAEMLEATVKAADRYEIGVAHRPGEVSAIEAAHLGVRSVSYLPRCVQLDGDRPQAVVVEARSLDPEAEADRLASVLIETDTMLVPLLHSWRRSSVLEEIVNETRLNELVEVAPFHSYLRDLRGAGAMTFGKKYAKRYLGLGPMKSKVREQFDEGWHRLLELLRNLAEAGVHLLPGSDATGLSLVPGFALHDELGVWTAAGLSTDLIFASVTQRAADAIGMGALGNLDATELLVCDRDVDPSTVSAPELLRSLEICRVS